MTQHTAKDSIKTIVRAIKIEEKALRARYTWLVHQNVLGLSITLLSFFSLLGLATLYYHALIPAWVCVLLAAVVCSISHEIEHDLIHKQYYSKHPLIHNFMMLLVWIMRPNTINPWYRRQIHLHHHNTSGTPQDLEERLVGNGIKNPLLRFMVIVDGLIGLIINSARFKKEIAGFSFSRVFNAGFPITTAYFVVLYSVIVFHSVPLFVSIEDYAPAALLSTMQVFDFLMVVLILPNIIRSTSLNFVTSSMHYYGGVNNVFQQTHVLTSRLFSPFHLFCFNFGRTHTIHHFVPNQPFYIRQLISRKINAIMKKEGVRFNDFESIRNANMYLENAPK